MLHVSCGREEARCYQLAGTHCPTGYEIAPTPGGGGNFLVRCRAATPAPTWTVAQNQPLAPSPYAIQETVQPWPTHAESLAPSPYRPAPQEYPPLSPGGKPAPADDGQQDLGF